MRLSTIAMAVVLIVVTISVCVIRVNSGPRQCIEALAGPHGILAGDELERIRDTYENLGLGFMLEFDVAFEGWQGRTRIQWLGNFDTPTKMEWTRIRNGKKGTIWAHGNTYFSTPRMGMYRFEFVKRVDGQDVPICVIRRAFVW